jgi:hypothetical protein
MLLNFGAEPLRATVKVGDREEAVDVEGYGVKVLVW